MPWYYAGPEAKPVGPVSLEELHARRASGLVTGETYIIEHTGQAGGAGAWRRYREFFPQGVIVSSLPPVPSPAPAVMAPPPVPAPVTNPLFPSSGSAPATPPPRPAYTPPVPPHAAPHAHYPTRITNACCAWGFGLGIAGFVLAFACGVGLLLAVPALVLCIVGFAQVQQRSEQSGRGLAVAGGLLALLALIISIAFLAWAVPTGIKEHEDSVRQNSE